MESKQGASTTSGTVAPTIFAPWKGYLVPVLAGSVAGACGILVGHPFDSLKVRMQVAKNLAAPKFDFATIKQLYRGMMPPLLTAGFLQAFLFSTYEACKIAVIPYVTVGGVGSSFASKTIRSCAYNLDSTHHHNHAPEAYSASINANMQDLNSKHQFNAIQSSALPQHRGTYFSNDVLDHLSITFWGGWLSGVILCVVSTPIQVIKIQQQVATEQGIPDTIRHLYRTAGWRSFYRAFTSMQVLEGPGRGVYFGVYELMKIQINNFKYRLRDGHTTDGDGVYCHRLELLKPEYTPDFVEERSTRMLAAATAGVTSWIFAYPFDVIKSRMQLDYSGQKYKSTYQCFRDTYREGGIKALYSGISYTIVRAAPVAATILPIYETVKEYLEQRL